MSFASTALCAGPTFAERGQGQAHQVRSPVGWRSMRSCPIRMVSLVTRALSSLRLSSLVRTAHSRTLMSSNESPSSMKADPATQSSYLSVRTTNLHLEWEIDWDTRLIAGSVTHSLSALHDDLSEVVFDTSYLKVSDVSLVKPGTPLKWELKPRHHVLGSALHVQLPSAHTLKKDQSLEIKIAYSTTDKCTALGWLEANQTASGNHPFLYSQCQAIHMRSLAPCMDTPAVKATYTATVRSYLPVLLSALRVSPPSEQTFEIKKEQLLEFQYKQPVPIPSYLIAIAAGEVAYKRVGACS